MQQTSEIQQVSIDSFDYEEPVVVFESNKLKPKRPVNSGPTLERVLDRQYPQFQPQPQVSQQRNSQIQRRNDLSVYCQAEVGQFPYPPDCRSFVNCWRGRAFLQVCAPGTFFSPTRYECDHPHKVQCQGEFDSQPEETAPDSSNQSPGSWVLTLNLSDPQGRPQFPDPPHSWSTSQQQYQQQQYQQQQNQQEQYHQQHQVEQEQYNQQQVEQDPDIDVRMGGGRQANLPPSVSAKQVGNVTVLQGPVQNQYGTRLHPSSIARSHDTQERGYGSQGSFQVTHPEGGVSQQQWTFGPLHLGSSSYSYQHGSVGNQGAGGSYQQSGANQQAGSYGQSQQKGGTFGTGNQHGSVHSQQQGGNFGSSNQQATQQGTFGASNQQQGTFGTTNQQKGKHGSSHIGQQVSSTKKSGSQEFPDQSRPKPTCPEPTGLFRHPYDCAQFLQCWDFRIWERPCAPGTHFNPKVGVCDFPYNVDCKLGEVEQQDYLEERILPLEQTETTLPPQSASTTSRITPTTSRTTPTTSRTTSTTLAKPLPTRFPPRTTTTTFKPAEDESRFKPGAAPTSATDLPPIVQPHGGQKVRLRNGPGPWEGLVEVYLGNNLGWGYLCDVSGNWSLNEANVRGKALDLGWPSHSGHSCLYIAPEKKERYWRAPLKMFPVWVHATSHVTGLQSDVQDRQESCYRLTGQNKGWSQTKAQCEAEGRKRLHIRMAKSITSLRR
ncbi:hypothetical protein B566_EDAN017244 [Ephemera danica]|nr:hypothetical protein B566_EDAN017244 [Ephemera danica]